MRYALTAALLLVLLSATAAAQTTYIVVNVTYPSGYYGNTSNVLALPAGNYTVVSRGVGCATPLPSSVLPASPLTVVVWRDTATYPPGAAQTYSVCSSAYGTWSDGFVLHKLLNLTVACTGYVTYASNTGSFSSSPYTLTVLSAGTTVTIYNVTYVVVVDAWATPYTVNVYVCIDASCTLVRSVTSNTIYTYISGTAVGPWSGTTASIEVTVTGANVYYIYGYVIGTAWYLAPTYNSTVATLGPADVFYIEYAGGPGSIATGTINVTLDGRGTVLVTPTITALNGTEEALGTPSRYLNISVTCYGSGITRSLYALVYASNMTGAAYALVGSGSTVTPPSTAIINSNVTLSVNLTQLANTLNQTALRTAVMGYTTVTILCVAASAALYILAVWRNEVLYAVLGLTASVAALAIAAYLPLPPAMLSLALLSTVAGAVITLLFIVAWLV